MDKQKISLGYRITHWFIYHPWLKLISLALAILAWFYARDEINRFN